VLVLAACGEPFVYTGTPGQAVPFELLFWTPTIELRVDGGASHRFLVDTGAPFTILDTDAYPDRVDGLHEADLEAFGLGFTDYRVIAYDALPFTLGDSPLGGFLGGDLLSHFALTLDYQGQQAWLDDGWDETLPAEISPPTVATPIFVPARVDGGGRAYVPGECAGSCGTFQVPATRILVETRLEDDTTSTWALVDTGATSVVLSEPLADRLDQPSRPRLDGVTVGTEAGTVSAYYTRVGSLRLVGHDVDVLEATSVPALVLPASDLFAALSAEVGREVEALIGGTYLRQFVTALDYEAEQLVLWPYREPTHIDPDEWIGPGFAFVRDEARWIVGDVYVDTHAWTQGVRSGDEIVRLDQVAIADLEYAQIRALIVDVPVGETIAVELLRAAGPVILDIEIEDLLPTYEGP
jgi:predicted aspartyl protease